jgi:acyl-CoA oxidase
MHILGPHVANAYVIYLTGRTLEAMCFESAAEVEKGSFKLLEILHHFSSGMKSISTDMSYRGCDELRSACGGAGYHMSSGVAGAFGEHSVLSTYEGVNVLMTQQSARYLLKQVKKVKQNKKCTDYFKYINNIDQLLAQKL